MYIFIYIKICSNNGESLFFQYGINERFTRISESATLQPFLPFWLKGKQTEPVLGEFLDFKKQNKRAQ